MGSRWHVRRSKGADALMALALLQAVLAPAAGWSAAHDNLITPKVRIAAEPLGYRAPGQIYALARLPFATLNFLDSDHLLFTFHQARLMQRDEHEAGDDQYVEAVVLELPSGRETARTEWRLHDRARYLWQLGDGRVLLRRADTFFTVDASLRSEQILKAPGHLQVVRVSPDGQMLMMQSDAAGQTTEEQERQRNQALDLGLKPPTEPVEIRMIHLSERRLKLVARADEPGELPASADGFVTQVQAKPDHWQLRFHPFEKAEPHGGDIVDELISSCAPETHFLNSSTLMVINECPAHSVDRIADAVTVDGKKMWTGRWRANFAWPTSEASIGGSDFAIAWLAVAHPVAAFDSFDDASVQGQVVDVLDAKTGGLRLAVTVQPVASAGQNYALSPDGKRLVVINRGMLEVYDVPLAEAPPPQVPAPELPAAKSVR